MKITTKNKLIFGGQIIATESFPIFAGHDKLPKIILFLVNYFWQLITAENRSLPPKIANFQWVCPYFWRLTVFPVVTSATGRLTSADRC
jgi:hypothetical protein